MKKLRACICLLLSLALFSVACKKSDSPLAQQRYVDIDTLAEKYYDQYLHFFPLEATAQGDDRYNDLLPVNISKEVISEEIAFYNSIRKELKMVDYKNLDDQKKTVYDALDFTLKNRLESYAYHPEYIPFTQFGGLPLDFPLMGSGKGIQPFRTEKDYSNWLLRAAQFPKWMAAATENFRTGIRTGYVLPRTLVLKMIPQMKAEELTSADPQKNIFYQPVQNFPANFTAAQRTKFKREFETLVTKQIIPAYAKMGEFLEKEYLPKARATDGVGTLPNGKEIYAFAIKSWSTTSLTPEEIHKTGEEQVAMLRAEMEKVKTQLGFEGSLEDFLLHLKTDPKAMPYKTSGEVLEAFNGILQKITPKLKTMFSVVPRTPFEIRQTEKFREATASAEYIQGTPDGKRPGIFYIPLPEPSKFNTTSGMESLFLHEAIPGHHYQISLQQENTSLPRFLRFGWIGAYGEGWAHYCETLGPEFGLYTDPYQKMGYLSDQMLRAVRLVIDTGLHTGAMTREEAIKYFLSNISYDEGAAVAEVERYMAMPGQAVSYKIGALRIRDLRNEYSKKLGRRFSLAKFHNELLNQGCLPLDVLDRKMAAWAKRQ